MSCLSVRQRWLIGVNHFQVLYGDIKLTALVGGIYSVLKSKAPVTTAEYGERYTLIGPLNRASVGDCADNTYG